MTIMKLWPRVVLGAACVLTAAGLTGCSVLGLNHQPVSSAPEPTTSQAVSPTTSPTPEDPCALTWDMTLAPTVPAPDFSDAVSFFSPFSALDLLGAGFSNTPVAQPGTPTVGVATVLPDSITANTIGVIGFDPATGKGLWGLTAPQVLTPDTFFSNGTNTLAIAGMAADQSTTLETVNAETGSVLASVTLGKLTQVLGLADQTVAVSNGTTVTGLSVKDLTTTVWSRQAPSSAPYLGENTLGQCVPTAQGYARIDNGTLAGYGFGTDVGEHSAYIMASDGSVFRSTDCPDGIAGCVQRIDPTTGQAIWNSTVPVNSAGRANPVVSQQVVMLPCANDSVCGYSLSTGQSLWDVPSQIAEEAPLQTVGQFLVSYGFGAQNDSVRQVKDGGNAHEIPCTGGTVVGQNVLYGSDGQTITAYDASTDLHTLWTVPMPTAGMAPTGTNIVSGQLGSSSGHLMVGGQDGRVWVVQPPKA